AQPLMDLLPQPAGFGASLLQRISVGRAKTHPARATVLLVAKQPRPICCGMDLQIQTALVCILAFGCQPLNFFKCQWHRDPRFFICPVALANTFAKKCATIDVNLRRLPTDWIVKISSGTGSFWCLRPLPTNSGQHDRRWG